MKKTMAAVCIMAWAASRAGGNPMLHVASLLVDRKTRVILGAVATNMYPSVEVGAYALTNRMVFAVAQKRQLPRDRPHWRTKRGGVAIETFMTGGNVRLHEFLTDRQIALWPQALRGTYS